MELRAVVVDIGVLLIVLKGGLEVLLSSSRVS
jgi:hypothetical protein